jgi:predicted MFS family arabinose efflux permease
LNADRERWMLLTLAAIQFSATLDFMIMMPLAPQFTRLFGLSAQQFGAAIAAYTFAAAVAGLVAAVVIERFDRKQLLLFVYIGFAVSALVTASAQSYAMLLAARALAGAFGGVLHGLIFTVIGDTVPEARRGRATGIVMTSFAVATVAGVPLALLLSNVASWRAAFIVVALTGVINILIARRTLPAAPRSGAADGSRRLWREFLQTLVFPNHLRAYAFTLLMMISGFSVIPYVSLYLTANVGLAESNLPLIYLAGGAATLFSARWIGIWADRIGKRSAYRRIALVSIVPLLAITHAPVLPLALILALAVLFFVFVSGRMVPGMAVVTSAARPGARGAFMTVNGAVMQTGAGLAATLSGALIVRAPDGTLQHYDWVGYVAVAATLAAVSWVGRIRSLESQQSP